MQLVEEISRALRMGSGGKDRPLVALQHGQPVIDIGGMVLARLGGEIEIGR